LNLKALLRAGLLKLGRTAESQIVPVLKEEYEDKYDVLGYFKYSAGQLHKDKI